jgi:putative FmdB family regulatory protein
MPCYTYFCDNCETKFELVSSIKDYTEHPKCTSCNKSRAHRLYQADLITLNTSIKKSDSELKTIGDIANRNRDRLSDDQKTYLSSQHNSYKEEISEKELPKGMSRIKKPKVKQRWTQD